MTSDLLYGGRVVEHLDSIPELGSTLVVLRHSERPSFGRMPVEQWDYVTLTERGVLAARDFGRMVAQKRKHDRLNVHSWGLKRCVDTAENIAAGARETGHHDPRTTHLRIRSPVADLEAYNNLMRRGVWMEMLLGWLKDGSYESLVPMREFTSEVLSQLLADDICVNGETTVVATHDLNIFPLISYLHGRTVTKVDFLDGFVLKSDGKDVHIGFNGRSETIQHAGLL